MLHQQRLAILGLGKIGGTLAGALLEQGVIAPEQLRGTTGHPQSAQATGARYGITVDCDNAGAMTPCTAPSRTRLRCSCER